MTGDETLSALGLRLDPTLDAERKHQPASGRRKARVVTEDTVKASCVTEFVVCGGCVIVKHQTSLGVRGTPDLIGCVGGRCVVIEVKRPGSPGPTAAQLGQLRAWQDAGALAGWVCSVSDLREILSHLGDYGWRNSFESPGDGRQCDQAW